MLLSTITETTWHRPQILVESCPAADRTERIMAVLGRTYGGLPRVDEATLTRYYTYLSANLSRPFTAHYPQPTTPAEKAEFRGVVLELLDPAQDIYDEFDGIYCKVRKGKYEINLPLIELEIPEDSPNFQLIADYCYWLSCFMA
jgi:hypothetical protein